MANPNQETVQVEPTALTDRERDIIRLLMKGTPNKLIAYELNLTYNSVREYNFRIFKKLGLSNRTEVAMWGVAHLH